MATDIFITDDFFLDTEEARVLYHEYAENQPIIDYHCHLPAAQIAQNKQFTNLAEIWLDGDHYKWRQMRSNGVEERLCTGDASGWEKFMAWAETVPFLPGNPLYHWTHLELKKPFGISDRLLSPETAKSIWDECNEKLAQPEFSACGIIDQFNVKIICTTDDPVDSLEYHRAIAENPKISVRVFPTFRPDRGMAVENPVTFNSWVDMLEQVSDVAVKDFSTYCDALRKRHDYFHSVGCRLSDHGIEAPYADEYTDAEIRGIFDTVRSGHEVTPEAVRQFKSAMLYEFGKMNNEKGWTQQIHMGAIRNNSTRLFKQLGVDAGFDSIGDFEIARPLSKLLDRLDQTNELPRTILYNLNPRDNELLATMIGNFQDGTIPGKMQFGSAWWFLDQQSGIERQLDALANLGLLSRFVGMLTDSRSFLSYPRHDYFRRILCNMLGHDMARGRLPKDFSLIGNIVSAVSYSNANSYFNFPAGK